MGMCVHLVEMVDDCPECKELMLLKSKVENLTKWLDDTSRDLSIKNFLLLKVYKLLIEIQQDGKEYTGLSELVIEIEEYVRQ